MDNNSIEIAVRVRPFWEKELPFLQQKTTNTFLLGDGNFGVSPRKPAQAGSLREVVEVMDNRQLDFDKPEPTGEAKRGQPGVKRYKNRRYIFDHVFPMKTTQEEVFERTAKPLLNGILDGYNGTIFAYGATGCGKTHTISGTNEDPGITVRTMRELFQRIDETKNEYTTKIEFSAVEIYKETIRDLLSPIYPDTPPGGLKLLKDGNNRVTIPRVTLRHPENVEEVMELVMQANERRCTSFTECNSTSSRSHELLQIHVVRSSKTTDVDFSEGVVRQNTSSATLSIIDLAGSERAAATRNNGERMREGALINQSLLALSNCISILCQRRVRGGAKPHVPYRNSILTRMLEFSLGGNCRTIMLVCVSPSSKDIEDTHNTLSWADKAKNVSTKISRNTAGVDVNVTQYLRTISELQEKVRYLEEKLNKADMEQSTYQKRKLEEARQDRDRAITSMKVSVGEQLAQIKEGAMNRALWDGAELRITSLKAQIDQTSVLAEKVFLESLVQHFDGSYRHDAAIQATIQREAAKASQVESAIKTVEQRQFSDALERSDKDNIGLSAALQRAEVQRGIAMAREMGYRDSALQQAEVLSKVAIAYHRLVHSFRIEADELLGLAQAHSDVIDLRELAQRVSITSSKGEEDLRTLFGGAILNRSTTDVPALPQADTKVRLPPATRRVPTAPGNSSVSLARPPVKQSPAVRRIMGARPSLPAARAARVASPQKRPARLHPVAAKSTPTKPAAARKIRWGDDEGEDGKLSHTKVFQVPSSESGAGESSMSQTSPGEGGDEWEDEPSLSEESELGGGAAKPVAPIFQMDIAPPTIKISSAAIQPGTLSMFGAGGLSVPGIAPPLPAWKANRLLMGKNLAELGNLSTLGEENEGMSSPEAGPSKVKFGAMGPPLRGASRPGPLAERHHLPPVSLFPSTTSSFFRSTAASAGRAVSNPKTARAGSVSPPSSSIGRPSTSRRESTLGPMRNSRSRARTSMLPPTGEHPTNQSASMTSAPAGTTGLLGGARRAQSPNGGQVRSLNRRLSTLDFQSTNPGGPRAPISSRPSISNLNGAAMSRAPGQMALHTRPSMARLVPLANAGNTIVMAGAGDVSTRAAWR